MASPPDLSRPGGSGRPPERPPADGKRTWTLPAVPPRADRIGQVRHEVDAVLRGWQLDDLTADAELLISELTTNAIRHAGTDYSVVLAWDGRTLRGEITDRDPSPPRPRFPRTADEIGGRGLLLVDEVADRWGVESHPGGKSIWFELSLLQLPATGAANSR
jgi:anti-sigma regulatory factor (Ser/Thr protein kinase)